MMHTVGRPHSSSHYEDIDFNSCPFSKFGCVAAGFEQAELYRSLNAMESTGACTSPVYHKICPKRSSLLTCSSFVVLTMMHSMELIAIRLCVMIHGLPPCPSPSANLSSSIKASMILNISSAIFFPVSLQLSSQSRPNRSGCHRSRSCRSHS
jgi:hypothetical protein